MMGTLSDNQSGNQGRGGGGNPQWNVLPRPLLSDGGGWDGDDCDGDDDDDDGDDDHDDDVNHDDDYSDDPDGDSYSAGNSLLNLSTPIVLMRILRQRRLQTFII